MTLHCTVLYGFSYREVNVLYWYLHLPTFKVMSALAFQKV